MFVLVGINDTWRRMACPGAAARGDTCEADYRYLPTRLREATDARLVLIEPFLLPVRQEQWDWRPDLDARIQVVRRLAAESGAVPLPAGGLLARAARLLGGPGKVADDGVHPTGEGHEVLARAWTELVTAA